MIIRRVKIRGKFYSQAVVNGKVQAQKRWSRKEPLSYLERIFRANNTFSETVKRQEQKFKFIKEVTFKRTYEKASDFKNMKAIPLNSSLPSKLKDRVLKTKGKGRSKARDNIVRKGRTPIQYFVDFQVKIKGVGIKNIGARSHKLGHPFAKTKAMARQEAWDNAVSRLNVALFNESDKFIDEKILNNTVQSISEGWVYYDSR